MVCNLGHFCLCLVLGPSRTLRQHHSAKKSFVSLCSIAVFVVGNGANSSQYRTPVDTPQMAVLYIDNDYQLS
jgi:hypothetical protein